MFYKNQIILEILIRLIIFAMLLLCFGRFNYKIKLSKRIVVKKENFMLE